MFLEYYISLISVPPRVKSILQHDLLWSPVLGLLLPPPDAVRPLPLGPDLLPGPLEVLPLPPLQQHHLVTVAGQLVVLVMGQELKS